MLSGRYFHFRPVLTIFAALGLAILVSLGMWQLKRLQWKLGLIEKVEQRLDAAPVSFEEAVRRAKAGEDMEYVPVRFSGRVNQTGSARVFGSYEAAPGYYYFAPLQGQSRRSVYVNFGFVPQSVSKTRFFKESREKTAVMQVTGLFRAAEQPSPPASWFRSVEQSADGLWFVRDPSRFAQSAGVETVPYYIDSFAMEGREWPRGGTTRLDFNNRHLEYALTWFGLAATLIGVWFAFSLPRR